MIYFVQRSDNGLIKIGSTIRLSSRVKGLFYEHRVEMKVLAVLDGGHAEERALHVRWKHLRARQSEWFHPGDELIAFINEECHPWDGVDEVPGGTLLRVSEEFGREVRRICFLARMSTIEWSDQNLMGVVRDAYQEWVLSTVKEFEGVASEGRGVP